MSRLASKTSGEADWSLDTVEYLYLEGVSWELYEHLLKVIGNRPLRVTYDNGELEIMSPLPEHEDVKTLIGYLIGILLEALDVPVRPLGSTTFKRRLKKKGLEPDDCFYIKNQPRVIGKKRINLPKDPPPDLVVEIDVTSRSVARLPIYVGLGVPEIWLYRAGQLRCLLLEDGKYVQREHGLSFPKLRVADLKQFIEIAEETGNQVVAWKAFRAWLGKQSWMKSAK